MLVLLLLLMMNENMLMLMLRWEMTRWKMSDFSAGSSCLKFDEDIFITSSSHDPLHLLCINIYMQNANS